MNLNRREFCISMAALGAAAQAKGLPLGASAGVAPGHAVTPSFPVIEETPLGTLSDQAFVLYNGWQMREEAICGDHGASFSQPDFSATQSWYPTTVPTTTQGTLIRRGIYPDPYISLNNMQIPDACPEQNKRYDLGKYSHLPNGENPWAKPYWFRSEFSLPAGFKGKVVWLHLDGINYRADVWVNGKQIGDHKDVAGMFERYRFNVTDVVHREGTNAIALRIHPLDFPGDPIDEQIHGIMGDYGPNGGDGEISRNVTQYCSIGWDWIAACRDRNVGIWQHIWLEGTGDVAVRDPAGFVAKLSPSYDSASLQIRFHCESVAARPVRAEARIRIEPNGFTDKTIEVRQKIEVKPGAPQEFIFDAADHPGLVMQNPHIWWPVGYGDHPLYALTVEIWMGGKMASSAKSNLGVRTVGTEVLPSGGRAFTVNGRIFRLSGGAWVPDFLMSWGAQRYRDEVRLMANGSHTCVRVNGCGIIPPEVFFDECDKQGLLVWQDFSRTSIETRYAKHAVREDPNCWPTVHCDAKLLLRNMEDCILRMRSHPSLLLYEGCNEAAPQRDFGEPMQNEILPRLDGTRPWLPCSSNNPSWEKEPIHMSSGGPYLLVRLPEYYRLYASEKQFTCKNEIGLTSPPPINSLAAPMPIWTSHAYGAPAADIEGSYHDGTSHYYRATPHIVHEDLGVPSSIAEYLMMCDLYTNTAYRAIYEAANKVRPRNAGTHLWKTNAAWTSLVQQVYDWNMCCNGGFYGMKAALKPLHVQTSIDDFGVQVVSTLAAEQKQMTVTAKVFSLDGRELATQEWTTDVPADATVHLGALPPVASAGRLCFVALTLRDKDGAEVDHQVTWMQRDTQWHELLDIAPTRLSLSVKSHSQKDKETTYRLLIENKNPVPAVNAALSILAGERGQEVLPCFWDDNSFNLLPGEKRELTVTFRTCLLNGKPPHAIVEGWNLLPTEIDLADSKPVDFGIRVVKVEKGSQNGDGIVKVVAQSSDQNPETARIVTWPMILKLNGAPVRTFRIAVRGQGQTDAAIPVGWNTTDDVFTVTTGEDV